jgi:hypothetical protein
VAITLCAHSNVTAAFSGSYAVGNLNWATGATRCSSHTLAYLRMANLDAFWAIEPRTVAAQVREVASSVRVGRNELGRPMFGALGPWPLAYDHGHRTAIAVIAKSQRPGRHEALVKHSAARKARTAASNIWRASALGTAGAMAGSPRGSNIGLAKERGRTRLFRLLS